MRSASTSSPAGTARRRGACRAAALIAATGMALACAAPSQAGSLELSQVRGHLAFGYARLVIAEPPAGSMTAAAGFDYPVAARLRTGVDIGFSLFGGRNVSRGSLDASIDYSAIEVLALLHWQPAHGPFARISAGPGLTQARAAISTPAGGASFLDLAVSDASPTAALDLTLMSRRESPVRPALILGARTAFRRGEDWTTLLVRFGLHY